MRKLFILLALIGAIFANIPQNDDIARLSEAFLDTYSPFAEELVPENIQASQEYEITRIENFDDLFWHIELEPFGYIIVSPNYDIEPIIAFSFASDFDFDEVADSKFGNVLKVDMQNRLNSLEQTDTDVKTRNRARWQRYLGQSVRHSLSPSEIYGPLTDTEWGQGAPYWNDCPIDPITGERCVVGCTATAFCQVINYFEYPPAIDFTEYESYESRRDGRHIWIDAPPASMDTIDYNGDGVHPDTETLAALMHACGVAVHMSYTSAGSAAMLWASYYMNRMGYGFARDIYGDNPEFNNIMAENMIEGKPATMAIWGATSGHQIVCDGYNSIDSTYHLNMGWDGTSDAWYSFPDGLPDGFHLITTANVDFELPRYATLEVPSTEYPTIQAAVDSAYSGDTIIVTSGLYSGEGNMDIVFHGKALYLRSIDGPEATIIDCAGSETEYHRAFNFDDGQLEGMVIDGFRIINGYHQKGGAIHCYRSNAIVRNCIIENCEAQKGGAIYIEHAAPKFENCIIIENAADYGATAYITGGMVDVEVPDGSGGTRFTKIFMERSKPRFINNTIVDNEARIRGNIFAETSANIFIMNSIIWGDTMTFYYGEDDFEYPCSTFVYNSILQADFPRPLLGGFHFESIYSVEPEFVEDESLVPDPGSYANNTGADSIKVPYMNWTWEKAPEFDITGAEREDGTRPDIGAVMISGALSNRAPVVSCPSRDFLTNWGSTIEFDVIAHDPDDDSITFSFDTPSSMAISWDSTHTIPHLSWTPFLSDSGVYYATIIASDGFLADTHSIEIDVRAGKCGNQNGYWNITGSPYFINCDIHILPGDTLIIAAGVEIIFNGTYSIKVHPGAVFIAEGSETYPIIYTASDTLYGHHKGIRFYDAYNASSISNCIIEFAESEGIGMDANGGALFIQDTDLDLENCIFRRYVAYDNGGAVYIKESEVQMRNCTFDDGWAENGGAIYAENSSIGIENSQILANQVSNGNGGGLAVVNSIVNIDSVDFISNGASCFDSLIDLSLGGAIYSKNSELNISNSNFERNQEIEPMTLKGSAIAIDGFKNIVSITNNSFSHNIANEDGAIWIDNAQLFLNENSFQSNRSIYGAGVIYARNSYIDIRNGIFEGNDMSAGKMIELIDVDATIEMNSFTGNYGTVLASGNSNCKINNNLLYENVSNVKGEGSSYIELVNNTIVDNSYGIKMRDSSEIAILNCVLWNNSPEDEKEIEIIDENASAFIAHSLLYRDSCATEYDNIHYVNRILGYEPLFEDDMYHPSAESPCVDEGVRSFHFFDTLFVEAPAIDIDGHRRPGSGAWIWDIGCYETDYNSVDEIIVESDKIDNLYPNPFIRSLSYELSPGEDISIIDITGKIVYSDSNESNTIVTKKWRPEANPAGTYFVNITDKGSKRSSRIIYLK